MTAQWLPEHPVDAALAAALIAAQFPALAGEPVAPLGSGWDNDVFAVGARWVFRFPRRAVAAGLVAGELHALGVVATLPLGVAFPRPRFVGRPDARYPSAFFGAERVPGEAVAARDLDAAAWRALARALGACLRVLHDHPSEAARGAGVGGDTLGRFELTRLRARLEENARSLSGGPWAPLAARALATLPAALDAAAAAGPAPAAALRFVHGDLHARHVFVDARGALVGLIDWGDAHVGEVACDLAARWSVLPPDAYADFDAVYGALPPPVAARARLRALNHGVALLAAGAALDEPQSRTCGARTLEWLTAPP